MKKTTHNSLDNGISWTKMEYPKSTLHELFAERAKMSPNSIALEFNDKKVTYGELGKMINQMANYLWSKGLRPGKIVAVSLDRTPELIASLFAVLQCGASYVPIDTKYPDARLNLMIEDSDAAFYIGLDSKRNFANKISCLFMEDILDIITDLPIDPINLKVATESPAYIIYTSGSTGKPKGVQVAHYNVINLIYSMSKEPGISATDKIFSVTTISFDAMVMEIYLPLLFGACVVLVDEDTRRDGQLLLQKALNDQITIMWGTPSIWQILLDSGWEKPLNIKALIGGEPVQIPLAHQLLTRCSELWNIYGPTETTVCCFLTKITADDDPITIGKPIANTQVYLLNPERIPVKMGEVGEIVIAGDGVSLGYLNRPELSNDKFIPNTFQNESGKKMYLSGDLGKLLPNGHVQCLGRIDQQVKIRGYRIELGEIEQSLASLSNIKTAVVLVNKDFGGEPRLVAYLESNGNKKDCNKVSSELRLILPDYMVPSAFIWVDKFPITKNGKIDRDELLKYKSDNNFNIKFTAPRTKAETIVTNIWQECLNIKRIDIFSDFFEMGGHSVLAVKVMNKLEKTIGKRIPLSELFKHSTVEKFAKLLDLDNEIYSDCIVPIKPRGSKVPLFMIHGGGLNILNFTNVIKHFDEDQPIYGIQGNGPKGFEEWYESIEAMAAHYIDAILKINPNGPYALSGFSFGGVVAFEMARQLKEQAKTVSIIALLDTHVDSSYYYASYHKKIIMRYLDQTYRRLDFLKEMLFSWRIMKLRINVKKEYILKKYLGYKDLLTEEESLALKEFTLASRMVSKIIDQYHLKPQDFEVELFRAKDDSNYKLDPMHLGWKKAALRGVNIHDIPGNHLDIVAPPNDRVLAQILQHLLDKKHTNI